MEKKKTKLTLSGNLKKSISNIEKAKTQGKNSVFIEKKSNKFSPKKSFNNNKQNLVLSQKALIFQNLHLLQMIMKKENLLNKEQQKDLKRIKIKEIQKVKQEPKDVN